MFHALDDDYYISSTTTTNVKQMFNHDYATGFYCCVYWPPRFR